MVIFILYQLPNDKKFGMLFQLIVSITVAWFATGADSVRASQEVPFYDAMPFSQPVSQNFTDLSHQIEEKVSGFQYLSIAFSSADLSNPESVFGHVFLVFHDAQQPRPVDPVIEFYGRLADTQYGMVKTVVSHIPGVYKQSTFGEKLRAYDKEGRDLFLRRTLPSVTVQSVTMRLGQLSSRDHPYDFLNLNCAFYLEALLTSKTQFLQSGWAIRQPLDVYLTFGDPASETAIRSTLRNLAEFERATYDPDINKVQSNLGSQLNEADHDEEKADSDLQDTFRFYQAQHTLLMAAAGSLLDESAKTAFQISPVSSPYKTPSPVAPRRYVFSSVGSNTVTAGMGGFDTRPLGFEDPVPSSSRLKVGEVSLLCERKVDCRSQVLAFQTLTFPRQGFGTAKIFSAAGRYEDGLAGNFQLGLGPGYKLARLWGNFAIGLIPQIAFDTKHWDQRKDFADGVLAMRLELAVQHKRSGLWMDITHANDQRLMAFEKQRTKFSILHAPSGIFLSSGDRLNLQIGYEIRFD